MIIRRNRRGCGFVGNWRVYGAVGNLWAGCGMVVGNFAVNDLSIGCPQIIHSVVPVVHKSIALIIRYGLDYRIMKQNSMRKSSDKTSVRLWST